MKKLIVLSLSLIVASTCAMEKSSLHAARHKRKVDTSTALLSTEDIKLDAQRAADAYQNIALLGFPLSKYLSPVPAALVVGTSECLHRDLTDYTYNLITETKQLKQSMKSLQSFLNGKNNLGVFHYDMLAVHYAAKALRQYAYLNARNIDEKNIGIIKNRIKTAYSVISTFMKHRENESGDVPFLRNLAEHGTLTTPISTEPSTNSMKIPTDTPQLSQEYLNTYCVSLPANRETLAATAAIALKECAWVSSSGQFSDLLVHQPEVTIANLTRLEENLTSLHKALLEIYHNMRSIKEVHHNTRSIISEIEYNTSCCSKNIAALRSYLLAGDTQKNIASALALCNNPLPDNSIDSFYNAWPTTNNENNESMLEDLVLEVRKSLALCHTDVLSPLTHKVLYALAVGKIQHGDPEQDEFDSYLYKNSTTN